MAEEQYTQAVHAAEEKLLRFLRTFESVQENFDFREIRQSQERLEEVVSDMFPTLPDELARLSPPESLSEFHTTFAAAIIHCSHASESFLKPSWERFLRGLLEQPQGVVPGYESPVWTPRPIAHLAAILAAAGSPGEPGGA